MTDYKELIEAMHQCLFSTKCAKCPYNSIEDEECKDALFSRALDAIKELLNANTWTPVSERLPENIGYYYVTRGLEAAGNISGLMGLKTELIFWGGNFWTKDFRKLDDVLAWMTLPEPWKGEQEYDTTI